ELQGSLASVLDRVAIADDLVTARRLVGQRTAQRAVTRAGDVFDLDWATGGSASAPSTIEIQAADDEAQQRMDEARARKNRLRAELATACAQAARCKADVEAALKALNESDARLSAVADQLAQLGETARSARAEAHRLDDACRQAADARDRDLAGLSELEARLQLAQAGPLVDSDRPSAERDAQARQVDAARATELEARLAVRTGEERVRAVAGGAEQLRRAADEERAAQRRRVEAAQARARGAAVAAAVHDVAVAALAAVSHSVARVAAEREEIQHRRV